MVRGPGISEELQISSVSDISRSHSTANPNVRRNSVAWQIWIVGAALLVLTTQIAAQGVATSAIRGTVRSDDNLPLNASVTIRNLATGVVSTTRVRGGRYLLQGLET